MGAHKFVTLFVAFYEAGPLKWATCARRKHTHMHALTPALTQRQTEQWQASECPMWENKMKYINFATI